MSEEKKLILKVEDASPAAQEAIVEYRKTFSQSLLRDELKKQRSGLFTDTEDCWVTDWFRGFLYIKGLKKEEIEPLVRIALLNSFWIKF